MRDQIGVRDWYISKGIVRKHYFDVSNPRLDYVANSCPVQLTNPKTQANLPSVPPDCVKAARDNTHTRKSRAELPMYT